MLLVFMYIEWKGRHTVHFCEYQWWQNSHFCSFRTAPLNYSCMLEVGEVKTTLTILLLPPAPTAPLVDANPRHSSSAMLMLLSVVFLGLAVFLIYKFKRYTSLWLLRPAAHHHIQAQYLSITIWSIIDDTRWVSADTINHSHIWKYNLTSPPRGCKSIKQDTNARDTCTNQW